MKSKKKMLLALGAMSIAAIGAGSVSTFAWFKVAAVGHQEVNALKYENITTANGSYNSGKLIFTASLSSPSGSVILSNNNGQTYYYLADGETLVEDTSTLLTAKYEALTVSMAVTKSTAPADATDASLQELLASLDGDQVTVTVTGELYVPSEDTEKDNGKTYYTLNGTTHVYDEVETPADNPKTSSYFEKIDGGIKLKSAATPTAHGTLTTRAADNGWANGEVVHTVTIDKNNVAALETSFLSAQTFIYGFDGTKITKPVASTQAIIKATVTYTDN